MPTPDPGKTKDEGSALGRYVEHEVFHLVKQQATATVNFALGNIGNFSGDYILQNEVNEARKNINSLMNIGMATLAGAKFGPAGAVIGFAAGVVSESMKGVFETVEKTKNAAKQNYEIAQLRDRAGLNTAKDGSRGTEN